MRGVISDLRTSLTVVINCLRLSESQ